MDLKRLVEEQRLEKSIDNVGFLESGIFGFTMLIVVLPGSGAACRCIYRESEAAFNDGRYGVGGNIKTHF